MCSQPSGDKWAISPDAGWCPWLCRAKQERAERKNVLALAQARKVDVILVTELTRWGRSARFAARSLTCFKFRFVSSPQLPDDLQLLAERVFIDRNETHQSLACSREQVLKSGGANILDDPLPPAHLDQLTSFRY